MSELLLIGKVARAHGNKGQVIVNIETDFPGERFAAGNVIVVEQAGTSIERTIASVRFQDGRPIIALSGIETMDQAEALAGAELKMSASALAPLPANTYYRHDLVGCEVKDTAGRVLGRVTDVEGPLDQSRLVVTGNRRELLIPLAEGICVSVDPASRSIVVDPPDGLLDLNDRQRTSDSD